MSLLRARAGLLRVTACVLPAFVLPLLALLVATACVLWPGLYGPLSTMISPICRHC